MKTMETAQKELKQLQTKLAKIREEVYAKEEQIKNIEQYQLMTGELYRLEKAIENPKPKTTSYYSK